MCVGIPTLNVLAKLCSAAARSGSLSFAGSLAPCRPTPHRSLTNACFSAPTVLGYNFNDSVVTEIKVATVRESWGGASKVKGASSSYGANAYMLMYRKIDEARNTAPPGVEDVPACILAEVKEEEEKEKKRRADAERRANQLNLKVFHKGEIKVIQISRYSTLVR